jgi:uracil-DNA glycosylase family 4
VPGEELLREVNAAIVGCRKCPRLVEWRERVARERRSSFASEEYWGRPVPGFGDPAARLLIVGLAPAAHGGNRTGRIFTGDRSGDWLFGSLYRAGWANQPTSTSRNDGLRLLGAYIAAVCRCAPPGNRPTTTERDNCLPYLRQELEYLTNLRVIVALGAYAWDGILLAHAGIGRERPRPKPRFGHGAAADLNEYTLLGCFHPSQQNTFTGKLTEAMLDSIFERARDLAGPSRPPSDPAHDREVDCPARPPGNAGHSG